MPAESEYQKACAAACPDGCGKEMPLWSGRYHRVDIDAVEEFKCTAPTESEFAQSEALARVAAEKRAEEAERELRAYKGALQLECTCDSDVLGRCVLRDAHPDPRVPVLEQERDKLRAALERYAWHAENCNTNRLRTNEAAADRACNCGLTAALTPIPEQLLEEPSGE